MKILHVISSTNPKSGGPINGVISLHGPMLRQGVSVDVVCGDSEKDPWIKKSPLSKVYALGPSFGIYGYNNKLIPWLKANKENYDAVIVNGLWQFSGYAVRKALRGSNVPYFVFTHGMLDPWFKKQYPLKHLKKWLYWPWGEYKILRDARRVIFTCEEEMILARESFWLYNVRESITAYGTSAPEFNKLNSAGIFLSKHPECQGKRIILFLSRIHEKKGCDILIEGFSKFQKNRKDYHLVIAGPDQDGLVEGLKILAKKFNVEDSITWPGMLEGEMKSGAYLASEIFCLPSHQENFGIVVAEALSFGKPVLISNKVNIWREILQSGAGLVSEDSPSGVLDNFNSWDSLSVDGQISMSKAAIQCFEEKFNIESAARILLDIIKSK